MEHLYDKTLTNMEASHFALAGCVRPPEAVLFGKGLVYRYVDRDIHQALIQKLARIVSGLHAARLLMTHGFVQEQGALQRMLDEFNEAVTFWPMALSQATPRSCIKSTWPHSTRRNSTIPRVPSRQPRSGR